MRPPTTQAFSGQTPVRFEGHPEGPFEGVGKLRGVKDFEHATLCRTFELDQCNFWFDLPSSCRGTGSNSVGSGSAGRGRRTIEGFVFMAGRDRPVASLYVLTDGDQLVDRDPLNVRDYEALSYRR